MQRFHIGAVTDVFSADVSVAAPAMRKLGMRGAELRSIHGRNVLEVSKEELERALQSLHENHLEVIAIASPLLKCALKDWPEQSKLAERAFEIAAMAGAPGVRAVSRLVGAAAPKEL